jgi:hypothetical protein
MITAQQQAILQARQSVLSQYAKMIKKDLPTNCTFLAPVRKTDGQLYLRATVKVNGKKDNFLYTLPLDLDLTNADLDRIKNLISEQCQPKN